MTPKIPFSGKCDVMRGKDACCSREQNVTIRRLKYWEIIGDSLSKAGSSWGWVSALDSESRTIWMADAHRDGRRSIVRADENVTALV